MSLMKRMDQTPSNASHRCRRRGGGAFRLLNRWIPIGPSVVLMLVARVGLAAPVDCPVTDGVSTCVVTVGSATLSIEATSLSGGALVSAVEIDGESQLARQTFSIFSFDDTEFIDALLISATADAATNEIEVLFREAFASAVDIGGRFTLSQTGETTVLDESIEIVAGPGLPPGVVAEGRIYAISDFDLAGSPTDASILATEGGTVVTQTDGGTTATVEVLSGPPTAHQVAVCCSLEDILDDVPLTLDGTSSVPGPDDFQQALSWDRSISTTTPFTATLRKTVEVPEPARLTGHLAAGITVVALAIWRRHRHGDPRGALESGDRRRLSRSVRASARRARDGGRARRRSPR